jgi:DNA-binding transcriptional ArsR family regulator
MPRSPRRPALIHPAPEDFTVLDILHALSDPTRMTVVLTLRASPERACGTFPVEVAPSTLTHHFRVLREAGIIRQREDGNRRWTTLREADLETRFPGLLDAIVTAYDADRDRDRDGRDGTGIGGGG